MHTSQCIIIGDPVFKFIIATTIAVLKLNTESYCCKKKKLFYLDFIIHCTYSVRLLVKHICKMTQFSGMFVMRY